MTDTASAYSVVRCFLFRRTTKFKDTDSSVTDVTVHGSGILGVGKQGKANIPGFYRAFKRFCCGCCPF